MTKFDRLKIQFSAEYLNEWDKYETYYDHTRKSKKYDSYKLVKGYLDDHLGLNHVLYKETDTEDLIDIEFTPKILRENYFKLISRDTIRECLENIIKTGLIDFDIDSVLLNSRVLSLDATCDIKSPIPVNDAILALQYISINESYYIRDHNRSNFEIYYGAADDSPRLKFYNKFREIKRFPEKFPIDCDKKHFEDILRVEVEIRDFQSISKYLKITKKDGYFNLQDVLNTDSKVVLEVINTFTMKKDFFISKSPTSMTAAEREKDEHMKNVIMQVDYDINKLMLYLKMIKGFRNVKIKNRYINKLNELRFSKFSEEFNILNEFKDLIEKSYS